MEIKDGLGASKAVKETLREEGIVVRRTGRGTGIQSSKKGYLDSATCPLQS